MIPNYNPKIGIPFILIMIGLDIMFMLDTGARGVLTAIGFAVPLLWCYFEPRESDVYLGDGETEYDTDFYLDDYDFGDDDG